MKEFLQKVVGLTGYSLRRKRALSAQETLPLTKSHLLELYCSLKHPFFVQIGANDGVTSDPIHEFVVKYKLSGICVEPQLDIFKKLQKTYLGHPVKCVNAMIGGGPLYTVKGIRSKHIDGLATSDKNRLLALAPDSLIEETHPPALSFQDLVKDVERIDLLQIDCEGYDYEILKELDFKRFKPGLINLESHYFNEKTRKKCEDLFTENGYRFFRDGRDTCAYLI